MPGAGGHDLPGAVLFACTMNSVRSPMAAAILRHLAGHRVYVESAGVHAGGPDVFAHYSNIATQGFRELQEGQRVSFDVTQGQKGPQAENIVPA